MKSGLTVMVQSEIDAKKHARYKVASMQEGIHLKRLIEKALDEYMLKHHKNLIVINLKLG